MTRPTWPTATSDRVREADDWIRRLRSGGMTVAELEALERWRSASAENAQAIAEAAALARVMERAAPHLAGLRAPAREEAATMSAVWSRRAVLSGAVAASAAAVAYLGARPPFGLWPSLADWRGDLRSDLKTAPGEQRRIAVAGAEVQINTRTRLVRRERAATPAIELIAGEVAVEAGPQPFIVAAGAGHALVRGAEINVRKDDGATCVTCVRGAVVLVHPRGTAQLSAAQQVVYTEREIGPRRAVDILQVSAWRRGLLIFHNRPLSEVIAEVNRYREGRIVIANPRLAERRVYASFHLDKIDGVVEQVERLSGARALQVGQMVVLS